MKFHKVLKEMLKDPKATFGSREAGCTRQDLNSIRYWLCSAEGKSNRLSSFDRMTQAEDWIQEDEQN